MMDWLVRGDDVLFGTAWVLVKNALAARYRSMKISCRIAYCRRPLVDSGMPTNSEGHRRRQRADLSILMTMRHRC